MAKRNGNRELKKPKQIKGKSTSATSVTDLATRREPKPAGKK